MKKIFRNFIILTFILTQLFFLSYPAPAAKASSGSIVRVGYSPDDTFFYKDKDGTYQGLYAEYLYSISQYTGWQYEFISGSPESLLSMLSAGKIDMLLNVNYTPENRAVCYFPDYPITMQQLCVVVHPDDADFPDSSLENLKGKKIGSISDTFSENVLLKLIKDKKLGCTYCPYSNYQNLMYAFTAGSVDAIVLNVSDVDESQKILSIIDIKEFHLAVSKLKPGILQNLNKALRQLNLNYPYYNSDLYKKYVDSDGKNYAFSKEALKYIEEAPILKVVYLKENAPFEYNEENNLNGIVKAYLKEISDRSGLRFEYIPVNTYKNALAMLESGNADIISSIYSDRVFANTYSLNITDQYYSQGFSLVRKNDESLELHDSITVSLVNNIAGAEIYLGKLYPNMKFKYYDTIEKCIASVRDNKAAAAILPSEMATMFLQQNYYSDIVISNGLQLSLPVSMGIRDDMPSELLLLLNQTLKSIPASDKEAILLENIVQTTYSISLKNMLSANFIPLLLIIFIITLLIIVVIIFRNKIRYNKVLTESQIDQLTGILNKSSAENTIRRYLKNRPQELCALYMLDIDRFKLVNDNYGHKAGDAIIQDTARVIHETFTEQDIIGRMGGDEFIVLQTHCRSIQMIKNKADKLTQNLRRNYKISKSETAQLTASIGIMIYKNGNYTYEELVEQADKLLYEVKNAGRNDYKLSV